MNDLSESQLLRKGKLKKKCSEPLVYACDTCGELFARERWANEKDTCPACSEGTPVAIPHCLSCSKKLEETFADSEGVQRNCHSVALFRETGKCIFDGAIIAQPKMRKFTTASERAEHLSAWEESGLSARVYAQLHGLTANKLYRWRSVRDREAAEAGVVIEHSDVSEDESETSSSELVLWTMLAVGGVLFLIVLVYMLFLRT